MEGQRPLEKYPWTHRKRPGGNAHQRLYMGHRSCKRARRPTDYRESEGSKVNEGKVTPTVFQQACRRTDRDSYWKLLKDIESSDPNQLRLLHMAVGISGEAGELIDAVKKHVILS